MKELFNLVNSLNSEERDGFYAFAKAKNRRTDVKNITLFRLLEKGVHKNIAVTLYGSNNKKALHALSKRLRDNLIDFIASHALERESTEEMLVLKDLLAARILFEKGLYKMAFKILERARVRATTLELYALLNEIYHTFLQYAHKNEKLVLKDIIAAYTANQQNYLADARLMTAYAAIKEALGGAVKDFDLIIAQHLKNYDVVINASFGFKSLYTLMNIAVDAATLNTDYYSVSRYMDATYAAVNAKSGLANKHLYYHIAILYLMCGTHFRNKSFAKAKAFLALMKSQMAQENGKYIRVFSESASRLEALIAIYMGNLDTAITTLGVIKKPAPETVLVQTMAHFLNNEFVVANKVLRTLVHSDDFYEKRVGFNWVIKRNMIEILLLIERNLPDLVESKMRSFTKKHKKALQEKEQHRVLNYMKLLKNYYDSPHDVTSALFYEKVEKSFHWIGPEREDLFVMTFYAWLKAKMQSRSFYEVTLELAKLY